MAQAGGGRQHLPVRVCYRALTHGSLREGYSMAKGYWIAHVDVTDPQRFEQYRAANAAPIKKYGGRFLVRGGQSETRAGKVRARHVVIEFESYAVAKACYDSPEYQAACKIRDEASMIDILIVEGFDG
jgi:uncharacterized protein (DUF1330 family)